VSRGRKSPLTSGERALLGGIGGSRAIKRATSRHDDIRHSTYRPAPVTLPRLAFLDRADSDDAGGDR